MWWAFRILTLWLLLLIVHVADGVDIFVNLISANDAVLVVNVLQF